MSIVVTDVNEIVRIYCVSARLAEERYGIELSITQNWPECDGVYVSPYWKPSVKIKFWEMGDSIEDAWSKWVAALELIAKEDIDVPERFRARKIA